MITANEARAMTRAAHSTAAILREADTAVQYAAKKGEDHTIVGIPTAYPRRIKREVIHVLRAQGFTVKQHRWYNLRVPSSAYIWVSWR